MSGAGGPVWGFVGPEAVSETRLSGAGGPVWGFVGPEAVSEKNT
jgi:amino acid transporter